MNKNQVVKALIRVAGDKYKNYLSGSLIFDNEKCQLEERGGVYGFAIKLTRDQVKDFLNSHKENKVTTWKTIGNGFYPLYWGKDINLGFRLYSHTKSRKTTWTLQLNERNYLICQDIIYGAILCSKPEEVEKQLRETYPDILKTKKSK